MALSMNFKKTYTDQIRELCISSKKLAKAKILDNIATYVAIQESMQLTY